MNYSTWNKILCDYYFPPSKKGNRIFLSIDDEKLINLALDSREFQEQLKEKGKENISEKAKRDIAWNDFLHLFYSTKDRCFSLNGVKEGFCKRINESLMNSSTPVVFPHIALFVIPLNEDPNLRPDAFYEKVGEFLNSTGLIQKNEKANFNTNLLSKMTPTLETMWEIISKWARSNDYEFDVDIDNMHHRYTGPFVEQLILTSSQRENLKHVFINAGLTPLRDVSESQAMKIMEDNLAILDMSRERWKSIKKNCRENVLHIFLYEFNKWDGVALIHDQSINNKVNEFKYYGTNHSLLLFCYHDRDKYSYCLYAQIRDALAGEEFSYNSQDFGKYNFTVKGDGTAIRKYWIWNDNIQKAINKGSKVELIKSDDKYTKLSFFPSDVELLELSGDGYISSKRFQAGRKYLVLIKNDDEETYKDWLKQNEATLITSHELSGRYSLYSIEHARKDISTSDIRKLRFDEKKYIKLVDTFILGNSDDGETLLYKYLPVYFDITGVDVLTDEIRAVFNEKGAKVEEVQLKYDPQGNVWVLSPIKNHFTASKRFQIYCDNAPLSSTWYKFDDFTAMPNEKYREIAYNKYGEIDDNGDITGLYVKDPCFVNWPYLTDRMKVEGNNIDYDKCENTYDKQKDYLLYYISTKPRLERKNFEEAIEVLVRNKKVESWGENKWTTRTLIDNYFRLGYLNYAYDKEKKKHILAVNKPTFILLPPKSHKIKGKITEIKQSQNYWTVMLSGARTPAMMEKLCNSVSSFRYEGIPIHMRINDSDDALLPQTVYLQCSELDAIKKFSKHFVKDYECLQECIYSNSLLDKLASVDEYIEHITLEECKDRYGDIENCECIDYGKLSESGENKTIKEYNKNGAVVTYFPKTYRENTIVWKDGKPYEADKHWGHFIGMKFSQTKVLTYDEREGSICVPIKLQLPSLYARAFTLVSGHTPKIVEGERTYKLYTNPFVQKMDIEVIKKKLSQN